MWRWLCGLFVCFAGATAQATVTYQFAIDVTEGEPFVFVRDPDAILGHGFTGCRGCITGSFTVDETVAAREGGTQYSNSYDAITNLTLNLNGYVSSGSSGYIGMGAEGDPSRDRWWWNFGFGGDTGEFSVGSFINRYCESCEQPIVTLEELVAMHNIFPDYLDPQGQYWIAIHGANDFDLHGRFIILEQVPEPGMLGLMAMGLFGLALRRRRVLASARVHHT